ncbi:MAG: L,D-transpeptidase family protein [Lachnospiraceae bacterium]|nr:L,D-transpeptidase family protein [Lachnospiraceae bacterium]
MAKRRKTDLKTQDVKLNKETPEEKTEPTSEKEELEKEKSEKDEDSVKEEAVGEEKSESEPEDDFDLDPEETADQNSDKAADQDTDKAADKEPDPDQPAGTEEKKNGNLFLKTCGITAFVLCVAYAGISIFYTGRFMPGTVIKDTLVQNRTVSQVNEQFCRNHEDYTMTLTLADGKTETLQGRDFDFDNDYTGSLNEILASQKSYEWPWYLMNQASYQAKPAVTYDEGKLLAMLSELDCFRQKEMNSDAVVAIENRMNHFTLRDERQKALNPADATERVLNALKSGETVCDLQDAYELPKATAMQAQVLKRWDAVNKVQNAEVIYSDGDITLDADRHEIATWIATDANKQPVIDKDGKVVLDEEKIRVFLTKLTDTFNTDQKDRLWTKYQGGTVLLPSRNKGFIVDEDAELEALMKTVSGGWTEKRRPYYSQEGAGHGNGEVGDTYVEVDLGHQKLYYFEEGKLKLTSDIVTGCKRYHNDTPPMITNIYFMQQNRTLHGENYATFVYYWMAFYNHYGLHDATWRSKFGGDIYLTDGSHGCVNMPKENAAKLYELVHVGTPVVLYE